MNRKLLGVVIMSLPTMAGILYTAASGYAIWAMSFGFLQGCLTAFMASELADGNQAIENQRLLLQIENLQEELAQERFEGRQEKLVLLT